MTTPNRLRHTELDWHAQSSLLRFNNGAQPMHRELAARRRLQAVNQAQQLAQHSRPCNLKRKRSTTVQALDAAAIAGIILGLLFLLDGALPKGLIQ